MQVSHAELGPDQPALIGVSGGRDSVVLLHFLVSQGWRRLVLCHLDHRLRGAESDGDARFVLELSASLGVSCEIHRTDVGLLARQRKLSIETCARMERDAFFQRMARKHRTSHVFLAHHAEDQAETVIGNLCRGAGLQGLSGMTLSATDDAGLIKLRPFLDVRREEIDRYVAVHGLNFREDSSNASVEHRRNRLRQQALPVLREVCQRDVVEMINRCARLAGRDEAFLRETALRLAQEEGVGNEEHALRLTPALKAAHPALQSRIVRHWLVEILKVKGVGSHEIEGAMELWSGEGVAKMNLPGGWWLRRKAGRLFVQSAAIPPAGVRTARP